MDMVLLGQLARDDAFRIVIASDHKNKDAVGCQSCELLVDKQASTEVDPVTVVQITGQNHQIHLPEQRQIDQRDKRLAGGATQAIHGGAVSGVQSPQGTVDMEIRRVEKLHAG